jgi:predicted nucleotidyltransferase
MDEPASDPILREAVERLVREFRPRRIYLFGSRAWGHPGPQSDYDLLVIVPDADDERLLAGRMSLALWGLPAAFDIVARTQQWWSLWNDTPCSLEQQIASGGLVLHDAA